MSSFQSVYVWFLPRSRCFDLFNAYTNVATRCKEWEAGQHSKELEEECSPSTGKREILKDRKGYMKYGSETSATVLNDSLSWK